MSNCIHCGVETNNPTIDEVNDINNLVGLCPNHHWEVHNGLIDIETLRLHRL